MKSIVGQPVWLIRLKDEAPELRRVLVLATREPEDTERPYEGGITAVEVSASRQITTPDAIYAAAPFAGYCRTVWVYRLSQLSDEFQQKLRDTGQWPEELLERERLAAHLCIRCEWGHPVWPPNGNELDWTHGTDVTETGLTVGPEPCPADALWRLPA